MHMLATRHRDLEAAVESPCSGAGLELATPVLERSVWPAPPAKAALLPLSEAWLLAGAAPPLYSRPLQALGGALASAAWLARLVCAVPVHWAPLYASVDHGLGANRFLHHTLAYRGPTLVLIATPEALLVVACPQEWRESHQYWGGPEAALLQLQPTFAVVERGPKLLYLNTAIRGYPLGLRVGADPRRPTLSVSAGFDALTFRGAPSAVASIEVCLLLPFLP